MIALVLLIIEGKLKKLYRLGHAINLPVRWSTVYVYDCYASLQQLLVLSSVCL